MNAEVREQSAMLGKLLGLERPLIRLCRLFAALLLLWLVWTGMHTRLSLAAGTTAAIAVSAWTYSEWVSARIRLDRSILADVAAGQLAYATLDAVLGRSDRPMAQRCAGTLRMLRNLVIATVVLLGAFTAVLTVFYDSLRP